MKLALVSDLHIDAHEDHPILALDDDVDLLLIAGDIGDGPDAIEWAKAQLLQSGIRSCLVLGNHEYYHHDLATLEAECRKGLPYGLHFLQCDSLEVDEYVVLGCTLWTDFALQGEVEKAQAVAQNAMLDYRAIRFEGRLLTPADTAALHQAHRRWLEAELQRVHAEGQKAIVMTHHAPSPRSVPPRYAASAATPAFASDLRELMHATWAPVLWVHGHIHQPADYVEGITRVVSHPRGYPFETGSEVDYEWGKLIELP